MTPQRLISAWQEIEGDGSVGTATLRFLDTGHSVRGRPVLVGIDGQGHRHLCLPGDERELGLDDLASAGVTIEVRQLLDPAGRRTTFVDVHCRRSELNGLFLFVAEEILRDVQTTTTSAFVSAHLVLERWRDLFLQPPRPALTDSALAALLAELLLLEQMWPDSVPPVEFWRGPEKGAHDFVCGSADFEVKSTQSATRREVEVHGLGQLDTLPGVRLYLWWVRLAAAPVRGTSVPETVERLRARGADTFELFRKLKLLGYEQADVDQYSRVRFEVVESQLFEVDAMFPRLTATSFKGGVPLRVVRLDYTIALESDVPPLPEEQARKLISSCGVHDETGA